MRREEEEEEEVERRTDEKATGFVIYLFNYLFIIVIDYLVDVRGD